MKRAKKIYNQAFRDKAVQLALSSSYTVGGRHNLYSYSRRLAVFGGYFRFIFSKSGENGVSFVKIGVQKIGRSSFKTAT